MKIFEFLLEDTEQRPNFHLRI